MTARVRAPRGRMRIVLLSGVASLTFGAAPALAQSSASTTGTTPTQEAPAAVPSAPTTPSTTGDIVVTAQRREQRLLDVPVSVSAVSGSALAKANVTSVEGLTKLVPGLSFANTGPIPVLSIRGVTLNDFGPANESPIAVYVDDVYLAAPNSATGQLFDVNRVEVLRGPQGTLFGRNATGGLVQIISNKPTSTWQGDASIQYGSYNQVIAQGAVGGPVTDRLRIRLAGTYNRDDGWQYNVYTGRRQAITREFAGRFIADYDVTDNLTAETNVHGGKQNDITPGYYSRGEFDPNTGALCSQAIILTNACVTPFTGSRVADPSPTRSDSDFARPKNDFSSWGASETLKYKGTSFNVTSITAYESSTKYYEEDSDGSPDEIFDSAVGVKRKQFSQEVRLDGQLGSLNWIVGGYYFHENLSDGFSTLPQYVPIAGTYGNQTQYFAHTEAEAGFVNLDYKVAPTVTLTAGARLSHETKALTISDDFDNPTFLDRDRARVTRVTWKAGAEWKFVPDWMLYASVSTGFKSPAFDTTLIFQGGGVAARPEKDTNYEVGLKGEAFDRRVQISLAGFYLAYRDFQIISEPPGQAGVSSQLLNADKANIYGLDAEIHIHPVRELDLSVSGTLLHNRINSPGLFIGSYPVDGAHVPYSPDRSLKAAASYTINLTDAGTLTPHADVVYQSHTWTQPSLEPITRIPGWATAGAGLTYAPAKLPITVDAFVENLTKEKYFTLAADIGGYNILQWAKPRTWGVRLSYRFR